MQKVVMYIAATVLTGPMAIWLDLHALGLFARINDAFKSGDYSIRVQGKPFKLTEKTVLVLVIEKKMVARLNEELYA